MDSILHSDILSRPFGESNHVFLKIFALFQIHSVFRDELIQVREDGFIVVYEDACHANSSLKEYVRLVARRD